jgi:hypothetical protein
VLARAGRGVGVGKIASLLPITRTGTGAQFPGGTRDPQGELLGSAGCVRRRQIPATGRNSLEANGAVSLVLDPSLLLSASRTGPIPAEL